jgi:hypothetical protein
MTVTFALGSCNFNEAAYIEDGRKVRRRRRRSGGQDRAAAGGPRVPTPSIMHPVAGV